MMKRLFICSCNQWRSPTTESLWRKRPGFSARSAGTSPSARKTLSVGDIEWADIVFVMEKKHKSRVTGDFAQLVQYKPVHFPDSPDEYKYMTRS